MTSITRSCTIRCSRLTLSVLILAVVIATAAGAEAGSLSLLWNAPTTNADGTPLRDLAGYRIYLGTATPSCPSGSFHAVSSSVAAPASGQTVATKITALTAGTTYFVRVTAVDTTGNESGCSGVASGMAQPDLTVTPSASTGFGSVTAGGTVDRTFTVQNVSSASITGAASVGAPFSVVSGSSFSLAAGASQTVTVRFRPTVAGNFVANVNFTASGDAVSRAVNGSMTGSASTTLTLSVAKNGTGTGTVASSPAGIACGTDCAETVTAGTRLTLTASAASGSGFAGWGGACSGTGTCAVTVNAATTVSATFNSNPTAAPVPVASSLSPSSAVAGSGALTLTVNGSGFVASSVVRWNGATRTTTFVSATQLRATLSAADLAAPGPMPVNVVTPAPGGGTSTTRTFSISAPAPSMPVPVVTSLYPGSSVAAGGSSHLLVVLGANFVNASVVRWNGADRTTTYINATQLRTTLTAADLASPTVAPVGVVTPGGGTSATLNFSVTAPVPVASSLSPTTAAAGSAGLSLTVSGSKFVPTSVVRWNGASLPTTFLSATQLRATVSATALATARTISVSVLTPAPGGGTSASRSFSVSGTPNPSPSPSTTPAAPAFATAVRRSADAGGVTFDITWGAASGAASYRYSAAFSDEASAQQGAVTGLLTLRLRMPYHASGAARTGSVCLRSVGTTGIQSTDSTCAPLAVPARPATPSPAPPPPAPAPPPDYGWGTG